MTRFGISNLIFGKLSDNAINELLSLVEICDFAPTVFYSNWKNLPSKIPTYPYANHKVKISGMQSLFYGINNASLVNSSDEFASLLIHYNNIVLTASRSEIPYLVYGSPGTRKFGQSRASEVEIAERVHKLGDIALENDVILCFEANSKRFGCDFLSSTHDLVSVLQNIDSTGLGLHLDVGQMLDEGLDVIKCLEENLERIIHLHLSTPEFVCDPKMQSFYKDIINVLVKKTSIVDVVLEVQDLGSASEFDLIKLCENLAEYSRQNF